jgi:hypothetical protein
MSTLREILDLINTAPLTIDRRSDEYRVLNQAEVDLKIANHQIPLLRAALAKYADPTFYDAGLDPTSKASVDRGSHAEWVLRMTDPNAA